MTTMRKYILTTLAIASLACPGLRAQESKPDSIALGYNIFQSKEASSAAVGVIRGSQIESSSQHQILSALYGELAGLGVYQAGSTANPDDCYPTVNVRGNGSYSGNHVLVLVDGVERKASFVDVREVESVTVLKDAASLALYGIRGADGAILITTRRGGTDAIKIKTGYTFGVQTPFRVPQMASPLEYASAVNEARVNDGLSPLYSQTNLDQISAGNSFIPTVDWQNLVLKNMGFDNDAFISVDGRSDNTRFYVYADYRSNRGFFKNTGVIDGLSSQSTYDALKFRSNLDIAVTRSTNVAVNLSARIQQKGEPALGSSLEKLYAAPSVGFPVMYHNIWAQSAKYANPVHDILGTGEAKFFSRMLSADLVITQDLSAITEGLSAEAAISYDNSADIKDTRSFGSSYYVFTPVFEGGELADYSAARYGNDTGMSFSSYLSYQFMHVNARAKIAYDRSFGANHIASALVFNREKRKNTGANTSYVHHDLVYNAAYDYAGKYLASVTASYSGSSYMPRGDKYRFYPAASLGWVASKEDFLKDVDAVNYLKVRGSYGLVGMDANLDCDMDIQFNGSGLSYIFISPTVINGMKEGALPSTGIQPELDAKADLGLEFTLFGGLSGEIDLFSNTRTNLRTISGNVYSGVLGIGVGDAFDGKVVNRGVEVSLGWNGKIGDFSYFLRGNASLVKDRIEAIAEEYVPYDYMYITGHPIGTFYGLVSDGFYQESDFDNEGNLLPGVVRSTFASVRPGDIKYKDLNTDGKIDNYDYKYQLGSNLPELYYGFQFGASFKGVSFKAVFQGVSGCTIPTVLTSIYQPLYGGDKNISKHYLENHWSAANTEARYPRLTTLENANNFLPSDLWTEDGSFLKLREVELRYTLPTSLTDKLRLGEAQVYLRGNNLFSIDSIGIMDPEAVDFIYPTARTVCAGLTVNF